jgi:S-formylglutathione hydrolase FrmB
MRFASTTLLATTTATVMALLAWTLLVGVSRADPIIDSQNLLVKATAPNGSYVVRGVINDPRHVSILVHSASMDQDVVLKVQRPADTSAPRPTLYLLNGAGGGLDAATWSQRTDVLTFLSDKNVNVVSPVGGAWSYYTDWEHADPVLGNNKWKTFLTEEIPPLIDAGLGTNGVNAIAGLSMSGTSALALAQAAPSLYRSVASYSGCAQTSDPLGRSFVDLTVSTWGGGTTANMWGPPTAPQWADNDPYLHADRLRGLNLFISNGSGLPGTNETMDSPFLITQGPTGLANQAAVGGVIEAATNLCTHNLQDRLNQLGIPATFLLRPTGTHSWGYWQEDFKASWPVLAAGLGI